MKKLILLVIIAITSLSTYAQEINYARVQDMAIWYNQSLKTDKDNTLRLNYRNVQVAGMIAYNSISAMVDIPLVKREKKTEEKGYFNISLGAASDKSNQGIMNNTSGLLGVSYAVPIAEGVYVAAGFQGSFYQSRLNTSGDGVFGDQLSKYGPISGAISSDRFAAGWKYDHFRLNAGVSIFGKDEMSKWYFGVSALQLNQPYTDVLKIDEYKLPAGFSLQGGYTYFTEAKDEIGGHLSLNWQGGAYKHFFYGSFVKNVDDKQEIKVGAGIGYRFEDAVVPAIEVHYQKMLFNLSYDVNISSLNSAGVKRNGLELMLKLNF